MPRSCYSRISYFSLKGADFLGKFLIRCTATGYMFDLQAANGETVATSEVYDTLAACRKGVESVLRIYGTKAQKDIGHVFHLNCRSLLADQCNDEQCAFFRAHLQERR